MALGRVNKTSIDASYHDISAHVAEIGISHAIESYLTLLFTISQAEEVIDVPDFFCRLHTSDVLMGYSDWPGLAQVFQLERQVISKKTGTVRKEIIVGVTSLAVERADAVRLLALMRAHWHIENTSHWVRDVTFDEDRSQVRCGNIPQVMAAFRNTVIGLLRWAGYTNIAAACRRFAAQPALALDLIGIVLEN